MGGDVIAARNRCPLDGVHLPPVSEASKFIGMSVYYYALRTLYLWEKVAIGSSTLSWPNPSATEIGSLTDVRAVAVLLARRVCYAACALASSHRWK